MVLIAVQGGGESELYQNISGTQSFWVLFLYLVLVSYLTLGTITYMTLNFSLLVAKISVGQHQVKNTRVIFLYSSFCLNKYSMKPESYMPVMIFKIAINRTHG